MAEVHPMILPEFWPEDNLFIKVLNAEEQSFLARCRKIMERLIGAEPGEFMADRPGWLCDVNGYYMEIDGWSQQFKIAIDYTPVVYYKLPEQISYAYDNMEIYAQMIGYIQMVRAQTYAAQNILTIDLPEIMPDDLLESYLNARIHEFTCVRAFPALPKASTR